MSCTGNGGEIHRRHTLRTFSLAKFLSGMYLRVWHFYHDYDAACL